MNLTAPPPTNSPKPPQDIRIFGEDLCGENVRWQPLVGGRTNEIWRATPHPPQNAKSLVVKRYRKDRGNPIFPNDPRAEWASLVKLQGSGLAPTPIDIRERNAQSLLAYEHVDGTSLRATTPALLMGLTQIHKIAPPDGLRHEMGSPSDILAQGLALLKTLPRTRETAELMTCGQDFTTSQLPPALPRAEQVFLHGDPTFSNVLCVGESVCFLDWQCPAVGDPCFDIATALSPAMHIVYGAAPLSLEEKTRALHAYGRPEILARYEALAPLLNWRLSVYCAWKAARGEAIYADALAVQLKL